MASVIYFFSVLVGCVTLFNKDPLSRIQLKSKLSPRHPWEIFLASAVLNALPFHPSHSEGMVKNNEREKNLFAGLMEMDGTSLFVP